MWGRRTAIFFLLSLVHSGAPASFTSHEPVVGVTGAWGRGGTRLGSGMNWLIAVLRSARISSGTALRDSPASCAPLANRKIEEGLRQMSSPPPVLCPSWHAYALALGARLSKPPKVWANDSAVPPHTPLCLPACCAL
jgi:hypothetical protein